MTNPVIVVVGAGPGLGAAIARRFGRAGYDPALIARSPDKLAELGTQLQSEGLTTGWSAVDVTDDEELRTAVARFGGHAGSISHLHFNPSAFRQKDPLQLTVDELPAPAVRILGDLEELRRRHVRGRRHGVHRKPPPDCRP